MAELLSSPLLIKSFLINNRLVNNRLVKKRFIENQCTKCQLVNENSHIRVFEQAGAIHLKLICQGGRNLSPVCPDHSHIQSRVPC